MNAGVLTVKSLTTSAGFMPMARDGTEAGGSGGNDRTGNTAGKRRHCWYRAMTGASSAEIGDSARGGWGQKTSRANSTEAVVADELNGRTRRVAMAGNVVQQPADRHC